METLNHNRDPNASGPGCLTIFVIANVVLNLACFLAWLASSFSR